MNRKEEKTDLESIINHPYPFPTKRQRMPMEARAAQFAPFAALDGHESAIRKTRIWRQNERPFN